MACYGSLNKVEIRDNSENAQWVSADQQTYNAWLIQSSNGLKVPMDIRITDSNGAVEVALGLITNFDSNAKFDFGQNFDECYSNQSLHFNHWKKWKVKNLAPF